MWDRATLSTPLAAKIVLGALLCLSLTTLKPNQGVANTHSIRGITMSTHGNGDDWANDSIVPSMEKMKSTGANWVTIHPYAGIRNDGSIRFWDFNPGEAPEYILRPIREAHALGMKVLIKPHIAYWGTKFGWRGDITFETEEEWDRFWKGYRKWILVMAEASKEADAFSIGCELDQTLHHEAEWRELIAEVRKVCPAPLTYSANWADFERVPFWDDLEAIGIQAYFPVADSSGADSLTIKRGWERKMDELRTYSEQHDRYIVFTELGYNRSHAAPVEPWSYHTDGVEAEPMQALCLRLALEAVENEPRVLGSFLWKWFPEPHPVGRNFQLATPRLMSVIRDVWLQ